MKLFWNKYKLIKFIIKNLNYEKGPYSNSEQRISKIMNFEYLWYVYTCLNLCQCSRMKTLRMYLSFWLKTVADIELEKVKWENYDMIIFIWWWGAYAQYFWNKEYLRIAKEARKLWAICIAPMILSAGVFNGKTVTSRDQNWVQKLFKIIEDFG